MPFFSIIIPVHNVARAPLRALRVAFGNVPSETSFCGAFYLRECLDSVVSQTFKDWELICVDDGSTDGSGEILDEYAAKDGRIKVFHAENHGVSAARNFGIDAASGEYVTFLDGDDAYERSWLESFWRLIKDTGAELVRQQVRFWYGGKHEAVSLADNPHCACFAGEEVAAWGCSVYPTEGWSWLNAIKRSCLNGAERVRFPVGIRFMEDVIFMLKVLPNVHLACQGEFAGYFYRQHAASVCGGRRSVNEVVRFFDEVTQLSASMSAGNRKCLSWMLGRLVLHWRRTRDKDEIDGAATVRSCVVNARRDSMFHISELPARWQLGFAAMLFLRSFLVMDLLLSLQQVWGRARRSLLAKMV